MALQDLTPQLRTRLNRMERAVGWFVMLATLLLMFGFGYYLYSTAEGKGWFKRKAPFYTYADRATGLKPGDAVEMMGFPVGEITKVTAESARDREHDVYLEFIIKEPYIGYLWTEGSGAQLNSSGLLGNRVVEVTKGTNGYAIYLYHPLEDISVDEAQNLTDLNKWQLAEEIRDATDTNRVVKAKEPLSRELLQRIAASQKQIRVFDTRTHTRQIVGVWNRHTFKYDLFNGKNIAELVNEETPALSERAERLVSQIEAALPNFLRLTNDITRVLSNSAALTSNLNAVAENARPTVSNLTVITAQLRNPGSLGEWLIPTNTHAQLDTALVNANLTLTNANNDLTVLAEELSRSLDNLANITSNLNSQVQVNTNILTHISDIVVHSDQLIQGLKHHWLLRSAFRTPKTNAPPARRIESSRPSHSPKDEAR